MATTAVKRHRADWATRQKRCSRCLKTKSFDDFYLYMIDGGATQRVSSMCRTCSRAYQVRLHARRRKGPPKRMPRHNAAGDAWCPNCRAYLPVTRFRPHPNRPGKLWAYCQDCTQKLERMRVRYQSADEKKEATRQRTQRKREQRHHEHAERVIFVRDAISTLKRRGFTRADICAMGRFHQGNVIEWERERRRKIHPATARTFSELMIVTVRYAADDVAAYRRRRPHPDLPDLIAQMDARWDDLGRRKRKDES